MNSLMKTSPLRTMFKACRLNTGIPTATEAVNTVPLVYTSTKVSSSSNFNDTSNTLTLQIMKNYGITNERILQKVANTPVLPSCGPYEWAKVMETLTARGLSATVSVLTILKYPALLKMTNTRIHRVWDDWQECFAEIEIVRELLTEQPILLSISSKSEIETRFNHLKAVVISKKSIAKVLMTSPQIMFQSLTELQSVTDYLSEVMVVRKAAEYSDSTVLGCTLQEVMLRHIFLDKCGKYKKPNIKQSENISTGNATLFEIYDTSEEEFATKVAGVTLEEFVVFQSMFANELENKRTESEEETDSDDD